MQHVTVWSTNVQRPDIKLETFVMDLISHNAEIISVVPTRYDPMGNLTRAVIIYTTKK